MTVASSDAMTSRERVRATVLGQPVDRVPVMTYLNPHAGCRMMSEIRPASDAAHSAMCAKLWEDYSQQQGTLPEDVRAFLPIMQLKYVNSEYALDLGADLAALGLPIPDMGHQISGEGEPLRVRDLFGTVRGMVGSYLEVLEPAVKSIQDLVDLPLPDNSSDEPFAAIRKFRAEHPDACLYGESFGVQDLPSTNLWEMSEFMLALYDYPDEVKQFQARFNENMIELSRKQVEAGADVIFIYDDYGASNAPLTSVKMWLEFTYPHLKKHIEAIHDAGAIAMLHSCGHQLPFLEYYIEAELDILQSFQPKAGNDFEKAYETFGDRLTFCTGIDVQQGERMTPKELREDILSAYRIGGRNGHHILGFTHMLQHTMPSENIRTILDTVGEIQAGLHDV